MLRRDGRSGSWASWAPHRLQLDSAREFSPMEMPHQRVQRVSAPASQVLRLLSLANIIGIVVCLLQVITEYYKPVTFIIQIGSNQPSHAGC